MVKKDDLSSIAEAKKKWETGSVEKTISKFPERNPEFVTVSGSPIERLYTPEDIEDLNYLEDLGFPGKYPYTRGVQPTMYRGRLWTMRQYAGFGTATESNQRYKYLLSQGQTGLSVAFDLPTQIGYDSDHPMAEGEVGKVGVAVSSLADMEVLLDGIPLDKVSTSMTINASAAVLLCMYMAVAEKQGVSWKDIRGTIQNDVLKEYAARGTYIFPPRPSMRLITDIFSFCSKEVPRWNTISISGYHIREAGSTAAQEIAFTLADGIAYIEAALKAGLKVDDFAPRLSFFFASHNDVLEEVAKFRAARRLWARIMKERFGTENPRSLKLRFHTQTCGHTLTAQQPLNNVVRVTLQALAAVLGGTQSLHTNSYDEALGLPTEEAVRIALRTQQIIGYESGVADTIDPLAGSYYVENMTNRLEKEAVDYINKIDDMGGAVKAIEQGYIQREIQDSSYNAQQEIEAERRVIVGVNKFQVEENNKSEIMKVDPAVGESQARRLKELREKRNNQEVQERLSELRRIANTDENLIPAIYQAVKAYATLGEICNVLRDVYGEYRPTEIV